MKGGAKGRSPSASPSECPWCGHRWTYLASSASQGPPRGFPRSCPRCRRQLERKSHPVTCLRCGHRWGTTRERPKKCPDCGSFYWDKKRKLIRRTVNGNRNED